MIPFNEQKKTAVFNKEYKPKTNLLYSSRNYLEHKLL